MKIVYGAEVFLISSIGGEGKPGKIWEILGGMTNAVNRMNRIAWIQKGRKAGARENLPGPTRPGVTGTSGDQ